MTEFPTIISAVSSSELTASQIRILYVDDDFGFLKATKQILEVRGAFQVDAALSVDEAMDKLKRTEYDVVISDYQMSGKDGLEFLKELRASGNTVPFILFTGKGREEIAIQALNLGVDRYFNKRGDPETVYGGLAHGIRQVVEKTRVEEELRMAGQEKMAILDSMSEQVEYLTPDLRFIWLNKRATELMGIASEQLVGRHCYEIYHKHDKSCVDCPVKKTLETGLSQEAEIIAPDGRILFMRNHPVRNLRGDIMGVVASTLDITESKNAEIALEESEERYRSLFESCREGIIISGADGKISRMNDAASTILGYDSPEELVGVPAVELYMDPKIRETMFKEIMEKGYVENYELMAKKKDGSPIHVLCSNLTRRDEEGNVLQAEAFITDITERKKVENALSTSEERYRILFESAREGMIITGPEGKISRMNKAAATILGYESPEELIGTHAVELYLNPEDRKLMLKKIMEEGFVEHYEVTLKKKDGSPINILGSNVTRKDEDEKILQTEAFFMDITERKVREEEMKRRLMRFRLDDGNLYLIKESSPALSLEAFKDLLNVGYHGLVFSRTPEEEFKKNVDGVFEFRWLAERGGENSLSKFEKIENNLEKSLKKSVILLDGLDYLILKNGFKEALFFVQHLREFTHLTDNVVVLSVDPSTLSAREVRLLEKEGREVEPRVFVRLPEDLLEILRFIYEHNALGSKPNYTDIRQELSISKPTVGKRIKILVNTGYLMENPRGRSKVLELTYKGMRLFLR